VAPSASRSTTRASVAMTCAAACSVASAVAGSSTTIPFTSAMIRSPADTRTPPHDTGSFTGPSRIVVPAIGLTWRL
jgi:hypothetical protein